MDFSKVTALQIPEGNVTKIQDKEGNILWANINKLAYGVRWDSVNQATTACERIGNLELHKTLPIQSRFKVCIHKGKEIQYYCNPDDSRFVEESKRPQFTYQGADMHITACDGLPTGVISCEEDSIVKCKFINTALFSDYRFLYSYVFIRDNINKNYVAYGRIVHINTDTGEAYIDDSLNVTNSDYVYTNDDFRFFIYEITDATVTDFTNDCTVELGCSINGYDGEIGVDTGGKFYQWSVDNDGAGNEVWQSLYKCVPYAREIKRHIIGIDRACAVVAAFKDTKWGWIGSLKTATAVNVINYSPNLRRNTNIDFDKYLGIDNFRCQLGKATAYLNLATMRLYSKKTDGAQMLYKQIWEAIVWSYVIEYADFDVKKTYNSELTTEGYHQGGLGNGVTGGNDLTNYNNNLKLVPSDYTLEFGNKTNIKIRVAKQFDIRVAANHYWNYYNIDDIDINHEQSSDNKILTITAILNIEANDIYADGYKVGGTVKYKITGLTDGQTIVFKREKGNLTIITDGTYDVEWGTNDVIRTIDFGKTQTECNITIEIISAPAYTIIQNQVAWNVPHWRGFNVFWYGDIWINVDNMINKDNDTEKKRFLYYTDHITKLDNNIYNKEHAIEGIYELTNNWLKEIRINNKGDIVGIETSNNNNYKNSYFNQFAGNITRTTSVGGDASEGNKCGIIFTANHDITKYYNNLGFVKVTILD